MTRFNWIFAIALLWVNNIEAAEVGKFSINGFGFAVEEWSKDTHSVNAKHVWIIVQKQLSEKRGIDLTMILAPSGPPRQLHNFMLKFRLFPSVLTSVTVGRFIPSFSREWPDTRIDFVETINYSSLTNHMVARDDGIQFRGSMWRLAYTLEAFDSSERVGGFADERTSGVQHGYGRVVLTLPLNTTVGASHRWGRGDSSMDAWEATYKTDQTALGVEVFDDSEEVHWNILAAQKISRDLRAVYRYEHWQNNNNSVAGVRYFFDSESCELKFNVVIPHGKNRAQKVTTLAQLIARF
jgi:hypothetical protein